VTMHAMERLAMHAMERLAMRIPGLDPKRALAEIKAAHNAGTLIKVADSIDPTKRVCYWPAPGGKHLFPVVSDDGAVITVLTEGMEVLTPTGRAVLCAPEVLEAVVDTLPANGGATPLPSGIHDIPSADYHNDPAPGPSLSSTIAKLIIQKSPLHAWTAHPKLNPNWEPTEKKTFDIGRAAHRAVLGKGDDYFAIPEGLLASNGAASTAAAKAFIEDARAAGQTPLKAVEVEQIEAMADVARRALSEMGIVLDPARSEMTALAEVEGVWCRAMVDNAPLDPRLPLLDFKTCEDASPAACRKAVENYGYDVQMSHYIETWEAACGERRDFLFIFQEKTAPHEIGVMRLLASPGHSEDWLEDAQGKIRHARETWANCLRTGIWPGVSAHDHGSRGQPLFPPALAGHRCPQ